MSCENIRHDLERAVLGMEPLNPDRLWAAALVQSLESRCEEYGHAGSLGTTGSLGTNRAELEQKARELIDLYPPPPTDTES